MQNLLTGNYGYFLPERFHWMECNQLVIVWPKRPPFPRCRCILGNSPVSGWPQIVGHPHSCLCPEERGQSLLRPISFTVPQMLDIQPFGSFGNSALYFGSRINPSFRLAKWQVTSGTSHKLFVPKIPHLWFWVTVPTSTVVVCTQLDGCM